MPISSPAEKTNPPQRNLINLNRQTSVTIEQEVARTGLLCTKELEVAITRCKRKVDEIIKDCRTRNCRFRDIQFDLEDDRARCLYGLDSEEKAFAPPADVLRVTQIFEEPQFFIDGPGSSDIAQGALDDCWFLSALSTVATMGLIDRICVHRDEEIGVYGFVFYRDSGWVDVVIDDFLCVRFPKYEELWPNQKAIYHHDKDKYESRARVGGSTLSFSKSKTENETWVPLLEKAYAKLHGDYEALNAGCDAEAIEALTGGVSTFIPVKDILDTNRFWNMLLNTNKDQLFGCSIDDSRVSQITGLFTAHSYSVLDALEVNGKRFVRIRNPWGKSEWKGPWSDGSKEWTREWLARLPELRYDFGDDGEFLMEYKDFLKTWTTVERSRLFDAEWKLSSMWLNVASRALPCAWNFGDVSFTFSVTEDAPAVIVLSQLNARSFDKISGNSRWSLDFIVYRKGASSEHAYTRSYYTGFWKTTASVELDNLVAGEYALHVRIDRKFYREKPFSPSSLKYGDFRKLGRVRAQASACKSIAVNFEPALFGDCIPAPEEDFGGEGLNSSKGEDVTREFAHCKVAFQPYPTPLAEETSKSQPEAPVIDEAKPNEEGGTQPEDNSRPTTEGVKNSAGEYSSENRHFKGFNRPELYPPVVLTMVDLEHPFEIVHEGFACKECKVPSIRGPWYRCLDPACLSYNICDMCLRYQPISHDSSHRMLYIRTGQDSRKLKEKLKQGEDNTVTLGLRIYTKGQSVVTINGQLRQGNIIA